MTKSTRKENEWRRGEDVPVTAMGGLTTSADAISSSPWVFFWNSGSLYPTGGAKSTYNTVIQLPVTVK